MKWFWSIFDKEAFFFSLGLLAAAFVIGGLSTDWTFFGVGTATTIMDVTRNLILVLGAVLGFPALVTRMNIAKEQPNKAVTP